MPLLEESNSSKPTSSSPSSPIPANGSSPSSPSRLKSRSSSSRLPKTSSSSGCCSSCSNRFSVSSSSPNRSSSRLSSSSNSSAAAKPIGAARGSTFCCSCAAASSSFALERRPSSMTTSNAIRAPGINAARPTSQPFDKILSMVLGCMRCCSATRWRSSASSFSTSERMRSSSLSEVFSVSTSLCTSESIKRRRWFFSSKDSNSLCEPCSLSFSALTCFSPSGDVLTAGTGVVGSTALIGSGFGASALTGSGLGFGTSTTGFGGSTFGFAG
ncbi:hypothetical protein JCM19052_5607 [Vibrio sp. JCM 19052]|nr:hypothetical protein JCM19052_5607 [Vibrio sp. JCM 19052]